MAWRDQLLPATFRGVPFEVDAHDTVAAGRRAHVHEYPGRDDPWTEDLGRRTSEYTLDAYLVGDNGSPAHAGMDLEIDELRLLWKRLPRPRGDGPSVRSAGYVEAHNLRGPQYEVLEGEVE